MSLKVFMASTWQPAPPASTFHGTKLMPLAWPAGIIAAAAGMKPRSAPWTSFCGSPSTA